MQLEISLSAKPEDTYKATDLGFLLHKNPARVFTRAVSGGTATVFYTLVTDQLCTAVLHLDVDPIALVRGKNKHMTGLLDQYVNDRPFVANSMLSVALNKCFSQSLAGKSKERQPLADTPLPLQIIVRPLSCENAKQLVQRLFAPLGYQWHLETQESSDNHRLHSLTLQITEKLSAVLNHLYVLIPVLDNAKHWWVDENEIDTLLAKGGQWLVQHPDSELITRRALKHRRDLSDAMLDRLTLLGNREPLENTETELAESLTKPNPRADLVNTPRLHDQRLDRVAQLLLEANAARVLDIGCGEGKLIKRLLKQPGFTEIIGVDPSLRSLKKASEAFYLDQAGESLAQRLSFQLGSLTYADRRLRGFDAATLVEVIEHIDQERLAALERSLFGDAHPATVIITTPNADYNIMYEALDAGEYRHDDHRFEWTRAQFKQWCEKVANHYHYQYTIETLGPVQEGIGAPSQLALFSADHSMSHQQVKSAAQD